MLWLTFTKLHQREIPLLTCQYLHAATTKISCVIIAANVSNVILNVGHSLKQILQAIKFEVNVQHGCHLAKCSATGTCPWVQEHTDSEAMEQFIVHEPIDHYLINMHSFHNADLCCEYTDIFPFSFSFLLSIVSITFLISLQSIYLKHTI